jgi:hypothetical protein
MGKESTLPINILVAILQHGSPEGKAKAEAALFELADHPYKVPGTSVEADKSVTQ